MTQSKHLLLSLAPCAAALGILSLPASAQSLLPTQGIVVASSDDTIPDNSGTPLAGLTFITASPFDNPVVDNDGHVYFRARFQGTGVNTWDDRAYFYGTSRADLKMHVRGGDQAPVLGTGVQLRSLLGTSSTLSGSPQIATNGLLYWGVLVWDSVGTNGITSSNDDLIFGGPFSGPQAILVQQGTQLPAPAAVGTTYAQAFSSPSQQNTGNNANGVIFFQGTTTGGDTSTTSGSNNQQGIWMGLPGSLEQVARRSNPVNGLSGAVAIDTSATIGFQTQINANNQFLYEIVLSTTQGTPAATPTTDRAYMVHTLGVGGQKLVREGDDAPGTFNGTSYATFNTITGSTTETWSATVTGNNWTRSGKTIFSSTLRGGDVVGTTNDSAVFLGGVGTLAMAERKGNPAPGTDGNFQSFASQFGLSDSGRIMLEAAISGGTVTTANDTGIWTGAPGALELVVREGQVMPGTGGSIASSFSGTVAYFNDTNRVVFTTSLSGGTQTGTSWWVWSKNQGLKPILVNGDLIEVQPGIFKTASGILTSVSFNNGDGGQKSWSNTGQLATSVSLTDGSRVVVRLLLPPETVSTGFCFGDGSGTACPCGNSGAAGNGCANFTYAGGAKLTSSGYASVTPALDTLTLTATDVPGPGLFFQGDGTFGGGNGIVFGDGLLCAGGTILRLGVVFPTGNTASYPGGLTPNPIHVGGGPLLAGDVRHYQCWYRDAGETSPGVSFCTPATYNLTQGLTLTWAP